MPDTRAAQTADTAQAPPPRTEESIAAALSAAGFSAYLRGLSAIDAWLGRDTGLDVRLLTTAGVADLARLFEELRYPGAGLADAALDSGGRSFYFYCADADAPESRPCSGADHRPAFWLLEFFQDIRTRRFYDPRSLYPLLCQIRKPGATADDAGARSAPELLRDTLNPGAERCRALMDAALILARYFPGSEGAPGEGRGGPVGRVSALFDGLREGPAPGAEEQRLLLTGLLSAPNPGPGLELLKSAGFIGEFWPELAALDDVDQSKECHPEGNAWKHTLETFRYRKAPARGAAAVYDLRLSLGLLLHDAGKPLAGPTGRRRFNGHAELGEREARRFLERLGFPPSLITGVCYLVRNHMIPAALPRLPLIRTGEIMASPLFPALLELYRCDESSSFKGLDGYYESSAAYQSYLRHRRNPYRSADGKKLNRGAGARYGK